MNSGKGDKRKQNNSSGGKPKHIKFTESNPFEGLPVDEEIETPKNSTSVISQIYGDKSTPELQIQPKKAKKPIKVRV